MTEAFIQGALLGIALSIVTLYFYYLYKDSRTAPDFTDREIHELKNVVRERLGITQRPLPPEHE